MDIKHFVPVIALLFSTFCFGGDTPEPTTVETTEPDAEVTEFTSSEAEYDAWAQALWDSLDRQTGDIAIPEAGATLHVPEDFYFLNSADAEKVLVEVWGNPPGQTVLGMLFPAAYTPFDIESWAVTIEYEEDGYVSDKDADDIDYVELLEQMQSDTAVESEERVQQGYDPIALIGWAADPFYDSATNKLHWAKEIKFGDQEINTLNYNIRVLGRKGVMVLNFIAGMNQKAMIEANLDTVLALAEFDDGSRYADFNPDVDKIAAYGLGALVTGKILAKTGFLAMALIFLKKFGIIILVGIGAFVKSLFGRKKKDSGSEA